MVTKIRSQRARLQPHSAEHERLGLMLRNRWSELDQLLAIRKEVLAGRRLSQVGTDQEEITPVSLAVSRLAESDRALKAEALRQDQALIPGSSGAAQLPVLLVVEDEPDDFILLKRALRQVEKVARVQWAQNAAEALQFLDKLRETTARICVVADVKLPGMDGFELLRLVKRISAPARITFAFLTGRSDAETEQRAYATGADAFLLKPARFEEWEGIAHTLEQLVTAP